MILKWSVKRSLGQTRKKLVEASDLGRSNMVFPNLILSPPLSFPLFLSFILFFFSLCIPWRLSLSERLQLASSFHDVDGVLFYLYCIVLFGQFIKLTTSTQQGPV